MKTNKKGLESPLNLPKNPMFTCSHRYEKEYTEYGGGQNKSLSCKCGAQIYWGMNPLSSSPEASLPCPLARTQHDDEKHENDLAIIAYETWRTAMDDPGGLHEYKWENPSERVRKAWIAVVKSVLKDGTK